ncbi:MAG: hypothetical protein WA182_12035 [Candidatus Sulfotelmatobacter sp.]
MICASAQNVAAPFAQNQLYWLSLGACRADRFNPASFFFASPDGSTLQPALLDTPRFITALTDVISYFPSAPFSIGLQELLAELTADLTPPAPVYPQPGDTGVIGKVLLVRAFNYFKYNPATMKQDIPIQSWIGLVLAEIEANEYSTPPAYGECPPFIFQFSSTMALVCGQRVVFDIAQDRFVPYAKNVQPA